MLYLDAMASFWREWVVNYDASHQQRAGQGVISRGRHLVDDLRGWGRRHYESLLNSARRAQHTVSDSPAPWSLGGALVTVILILAANAKRLLRTLQRRGLAAHPEKSPRAASTIWYERMTQLVAKQGWRKTPSQTPSEFVKTIEDPAIRRSVEEFTRRYERARFGESSEDARRLPEIYQEISAATAPLEVPHNPAAHIKIALAAVAGGDIQLRNSGTEIPDLAAQAERVPHAAHPTRRRIWYTPVVVPVDPGFLPPNTRVSLSLKCPKPPPKLTHGDTAVSAKMFNLAAGVMK